MNFIRNRSHSIFNRSVIRLLLIKEFNNKLNQPVWLSKELWNFAKYLNNSNLFAPNHGLNSVLFLNSIKQSKNSLINLRILRNLSNKSAETQNKHVETHINQAESNFNLNMEVDEEEKEREKEKIRMRNRQVKGARISMFIICGIFTGSVIWALYYWGLPKKDEQGNEIIDRFSEYSFPKQVILRTWNELVNFQEEISGPSRELLLPPPLTYPYMQPPYTLVIELKDLLVFFDWDYQTGWGCKTRPFLKKFFEQTGPPYFEIVIFTDLQPYLAFGILEGIDKDGYIMHRLFKDSTRYINGKNVKDLNILNRDLSKTIQIEVDKDACSLNPRNCLVLKKWKGNTADETLLDLSRFLRTIASQRVEDVRDIISHYSQFDDPLKVFKENQMRAIEEEEKRKNSQPLTSLVKKKI